MGDPEDYCIAREGVWGREGARDRRWQQAGGFILRALGAIFLRGNEVKSILAALRKQGFGAFSDPTSSEQVTWF